METQRVRFVISGMYTLTIRHPPQARSASGRQDRSCRDFVPGAEVWHRGEFSRSSANDNGSIELKSQRFSENNSPVARRGSDRGTQGGHGAGACTEQRVNHNHPLPGERQRVICTKAPSLVRKSPLWLICKLARVVSQKQGKNLILDGSESRATIPFLAD